MLFEKDMSYRIVVSIKYEFKPQVCNVVEKWKNRLNPMNITSKVKLFHEADRGIPIATFLSVMYDEEEKRRRKKMKKKDEEKRCRNQ